MTKKNGRDMFFYIFNLVRIILYILSLHFLADIKINEDTVLAGQVLIVGILITISGCFTLLNVLMDFPSSKVGKGFQCHK